MEEYYYYDGYKAVGPHSLWELKGMYAMAVISTQTPVIRKGEKEWRTLEMYCQLPSHEQNHHPPSLFSNWGLGDRIAAVLISLIGIMLIVCGLRFMRDDYRVINDFATTKGRLTGNPQAMRMGGRRTRHTEYLVTYTFTIDGRNYEGRDYLKTYPENNTLIIYYNPDNPTENHAQLPETWIGWAALGFGILFTGGSIFEIGRAWWKWKRLVARRNS